MMEERLSEVQRNTADSVRNQGIMKMEVLSP